MDDFTYLILIIILLIFMIFYGGHNYQNEIEYSSNYFTNLNSIITFENKIKSLFETKQNDFTLENNYININKYLNTKNILIPNFVNCFLIKIYPYKIFNILNIISSNDIKMHIMILFNHKKTNNLELIIDINKCDIYENNIINTNSNINKICGYFYDLEKKISIVDIYDIYNNSNKPIEISCFIIKKPFWHN